MQHIQVSIHRSNIPVKGLESVTKVINTYGNGFTPGAKTTGQVTADAIGKSHGSNGRVAVGIFLISDKVSGSSQLVDNLLKEAKKDLETQRNFSKRFDKQAVGTVFFKTKVDIRVLGHRDLDMYSIGIHAAYVGDEPEQGLAEHFGIPRTLMSCSVEVETKPLSDYRFELDFEPVLRNLDAVLDTKKITGKQVVRAMMSKYDDGIKASLVLQAKDGLEVLIQPGRVGSRMKHSQGTPLDTWSSKGSVFSGELERDYGNNDESAKATPTFLVVIYSSQKDCWGRSFPIWQPNQQEKAIDLANQIATALK